MIEVKNIKKTYIGKDGKESRGLVDVSFKPLSVEIAVSNCFIIAVTFSEDNPASTCCFIFCRPAVKAAAPPVNEDSGLPSSTGVVMPREIWFAPSEIAYKAFTPSFNWPTPSVYCANAAFKRSAPLFNVNAPSQAGKCNRANYYMRMQIGGDGSIDPRLQRIFDNCTLLCFYLR